MYYGMDPTFLLLIPALLLSLYAQFKVQSTFARFSEVRSKSGLTGAEAGRKLLDAAGLNHVPVRPQPGNLTDHYDPRDKTLHLSEGVYANDSVAAIGVTAHEVGHAIQDARSYAPLALRSNLVPVANFGSQMAIPLFFAGLLFSLKPLMDVGIIAFSLAVAFQVVTLPVELNASSRAIKIIKDSAILAEDEVPMAKKVLSAAALTYIAATAMAVLNLIRLLALRGRNH